MEKAPEFLVFAYFIEPSIDRGCSLTGILNWVMLLVMLVLVNGLLRLVTSLGRKGRSRLDWVEE